MIRIKQRNNFEEKQQKLKIICKGRLTKILNRLLCQTCFTHLMLVLIKCRMKSEAIAAK
jgi:hypothetical protein